jgi:hypothetical protein
MWGLRRFVVVMGWGLWMGECYFVYDCADKYTFYDAYPLSICSCDTQNASGKDGESIVENASAQ